MPRTPSLRQSRCRAQQPPGPDSARSGSHHAAGKRWRPKPGSEDPAATPAAGVRVLRASKSPAWMEVGRVKPGEQWDLLGGGQAPGPGSGKRRCADREGGPGLGMRSRSRSSEEGDCPGTAGRGIPRELVPSQGAGSTGVDPGEESGPMRAEAGAGTRSRHRRRRGGGAIPLTAGIDS